MIDRPKFDDAFQYFDQDVILNIIDIFEKELPERLNKIRENIRDNDFDALAFNAHSLKGVIVPFMAPEASELARQMEEMAIEKDGQDLLEVYMKLNDASTELLRELTEIRKELLA